MASGANSTFDGYAQAIIQGAIAAQNPGWFQNATTPEIQTLINQVAVAVQLMMVSRQNFLAGESTTTSTPTS